MVFSRKGRMIDVRELQKRGVVRIPKNDIEVPTNNDGFVEMNNSGQIKKSENNSNANFFGFMDNNSREVSKNNFSSQIDGYNKREVDAKITDLDNKIYKLENRIDLIEKKIGVNQPMNNSVGPMGW